MPPGMQHSDKPAKRSVALSTHSSRTSHPLPTAHSATLPRLPTELVIGIFKASDSFATASALSKTSHRLYSVWNVNIDAILPSVVDCFPQAQELARAQEFAHAQEVRPGRLMVAPPRKSIKTAQRISKNATLTSCILQSYEIRVVYDSARMGVKRDELLMPNERTDFVRASYRAMTLAATANGRGVPHSFFESLDMLGYMQLREAMGFLRFWFDTETKNPQNHNLHLEISDLAKAVPHALKNLMFFHFDLMRLPVDLGEFRYGDSAPSDFYFTVADGYQRKAVSGRGAMLADLLPLLAKEYTFVGPNGPFSGRMGYAM